MAGRCPQKVWLKKMIGVQRSTTAGPSIAPKPLSRRIEPSRRTAMPSESACSTAYPRTPRAARNGRAASASDGEYWAYSLPSEKVPY